MWASTRSSSLENGISRYMHACARVYLFFFALSYRSDRMKLNEMFRISRRTALIDSSLILLRHFYSCFCFAIVILRINATSSIIDWVTFQFRVNEVFTRGRCSLTNDIVIRSESSLIESKSHLRREISHLSLRLLSQLRFKTHLVSYPLTRMDLNIPRIDKRSLCFDSSLVGRTVGQTDMDSVGNNV